MLAGFATAFALVWRSDRSALSALALAVSYACGTAAFAAELIFVNEHVISISRVFEDGLYVATATFFGMGVSWHFGGRWPAVAGAGLAAAAVASNAWYSAIEPDVMMRTTTLSVGTALLMGLGLTAGWGTRPAQRVLFGGVAALCLAVVANAALNAGALSPTRGADYEVSVFNAVLNLSVNVLASVVALAFLADHLLARIDALQRASDRDALTGTLNRRGFDQHALALAPGTAAVLILADIDHFKRVNDRHGHPAGDAVLRRFARMLGEVAPPGSAIGRMGGEEFALLVPGLDRSTGRLLAEGLRAATAALDLSDVAGDLAITASFGVAPARGSLTDTYAAADTLLYAAKSLGRDRVVAASSEMTDDEMVGTDMADAGAPALRRA